MKTHIIKAFPKIRSTKQKFSDTEAGKLLDKRKKLKLMAEIDPSEENSAKLEYIDNKIADKISERYRAEIEKSMGHLTAEDGGINHQGVWKAKSDVVPSDKIHTPVALKDGKGNWITNPEGIKNFCLQEVEKRLRHRDIRPDLKPLKRLKEELCQKRLEVVKNTKSEPWTMEELEQVLHSLQKNKCRDPHGFVNEVFKYASAGADLKLSLLYMLNKTKDTLVIPDIMKNVNIVMIPKQGKPDLQNIENQRGIFLLSIFRSIIMKLLLKDEYKKLDTFMSDANAGGRKGRRPQDHLFIINGIIFEHARHKTSKPISLGIYDCEQCFDSLWQDEVINNLYEAGIRNDKLSLLQKINQENCVAVQTHGGISQRKVVKKIICQGDPWGPIECSLQIDEIGKESLQTDLEPYKYKGQVEIPALGWIDDIITVSESGHKTARLNAFINAHLAIKKLRLGAKKCVTLHVGKYHEEFKHVQLFVDGWGVKGVESYDAEDTKWEDILDQELKEISHLDSEKYLGQILSSDSKNIKNIIKLRNKGIGIKKQNHTNSTKYSWKCLPF